MHIDLKTIAIGIQQRLNSTRLPQKALEYIGDKRVTEHVVSCALNASSYINRHTHRTGLKCSVFLLVPDDDLAIFKKRLNISYMCRTMSGPEQDVLTRYEKMVLKQKPDYIVRLTGDCPLLPPPVIVKAINIAVKNDCDFVTNAFPKYRTFFDGADCEVMSRDAFNWLNENAVLEDREHVTSLLYKEQPDWCKMAHLFSNMDLTHTKLSIDTPEDLVKARYAYDSVETKIKDWTNKYGRKTLHRF